MPHRWWKVEVALERAELLREELSALFISYGRPRGAAVFANPESLLTGTLFLTPKAAEIAPAFCMTYGAVPCEPPTEGVLIIGHDEDRAMIPPLRVPAMGEPDSEKTEVPTEKSETGSLR